MTGRGGGRKEGKASKKEGGNELWRKEGMGGERDGGRRGDREQQATKKILG